MKKALAWTCSLALIGVVTGTAFARPLPAGYTRVEYICGDGATCCFDTDFRPNPSTDRIEVRLTLTENANGHTVFSARSVGNPPDSWTLFLIKAGSEGYRYDVSTSGFNQSYPLSMNRPYVFTAEGKTLKINDALVHTSPNYLTVAAGGTLTLYAAHGASGFVGYSTYRLHSVRIWRSGVLIHTLVPVTDADGTATLFDLEAESLTLTKHGTFTAGEPLSALFEADEIPAEERCLPAGGRCTPHPCVHDRQTKALLAEGADYALSWSGNDDLGPAQVIVRGTGAYAGQQLVKDFDVIAGFPEGFRLVEYIEPTGADPSWFETDFVPNPQTDKIEVLLTILAAGGNVNHTVFSARNRDTNEDSWTTFIGGLAIRYDYGNTAGSPQSALIDVGGTYRFTAENNALSAVGYVITHTAVPAFEQTGGPLRLYAAWNKGEPVSPGQYQLRSCRVWRAGALIHDFVPMRDAQGCGTLVDCVAQPATVTQHGQFTVGPETGRMLLDPLPIVTLHGGRPAEVHPVVRDQVSGVALVEGVDYTLVWANNATHGFGRVTVVGKGAYAGLERQADFEITLPLPAEYGPIAFLSSRGATAEAGAYVNTGYCPTSKTRVYVRYTDQDSDADQSRSTAAVGTRQETGSRFIAFNSMSQWNLHYGAQTGPARPYVSGDHIYDLDGRKWQADDRTVAFTDETFAIGHPLYAFAVDRAGEAEAFKSMDLHSLMIWEEGVLKRHFVPCRRLADNVLGLYDISGCSPDPFYPNAGGEGTAFAEIAPSFDCAAVDDQVYDGREPCQPHPEVRIALSKRLPVEGVDYELSWTNNFGRGTGLMTVTGKGGSASASPLSKNFTVLSALPKGYTELQSARGDGTAYIDLGMKFQMPDVITLICRLLPGTESLVAGAMLYGSRNSDPTGTMISGYSANGLVVDYYVASSQDGRRLDTTKFPGWETAADLVGRRMEICSGPTSASMTDLDARTSISVARSNIPPFETPSTAWLLTVNGNRWTERCFDGDVYGFRIDRAEGTRFHLVPCRREADGAVGFYDISGHSAEPFFTSANSGVLTGGPDANALVIAAIPRQTLRRGRPSEPHPAVTLHTASGDQPLVENVDYRLSWRHNTQKGTAVVVARGCGGLSGLVATAEFEVAGPNGLVFYLK